MTRLILASLFLWFVVLVMACTIVSADSAGTGGGAEKIHVEGLSVKLEFRGNIPAPIKTRIEESVKNVGIKALEGKSIEEAEALKVSLEQVMKKIFNEVLSGFQVLDLKMELGPPAVITLELDVEKPQIEKVKFELVPQAGIHEYWHSQFFEKLRETEAGLSEQLSGIPVESARWTGVIVSGIVREQLARVDYFIGFELEPDVEIGTETLIRLSVKPVSQTVRSVTVKTRSTTMPSLLLERLKFDLATHAEFLIGLPIEFALAHEKDIIDYFYDYVESNSQANRLGLEIEVKPVLNERNFTIKVRAESEKYSGFLRGKVSVGKETRNPDIEGHLGLFVRKGTEIFSEINFLPGPIELQFNLGVGQRLGGSSIYVAAGRDFVDNINRIWLNYYLTEDVVFSWEKNVVNIEKERIEGSVTFKAHDFFSVDLVTDFHTDVWVRFVANL